MVRRQEETEMLDEAIRTPVEIVDEHLNSVPVDVHEMARALGLKITYDPTMSGEISGKIECPIDGPCRITVNANHSPVRQRFTIAHEIAHYVLHRDRIGDGVVDNGLYRSRLGEPIERQANRYAAVILMPRDLVRERWQAGSRTAEALARDFGVSAAVAEIRMRELGCVLWPR
jgi:Zn-dependent peptidase ImmA (M78 family)